MTKYLNNTEIIRKEYENSIHYQLSITKHFALKYMNKWKWDLTDLKEALKNPQKIVKNGNKYEVYVIKHGAKKIIIASDTMMKRITIISGAEGT